MFYEAMLLSTRLMRYASFPYAAKGASSSAASATLPSCLIRVMRASSDGKFACKKQQQRFQGKKTSPSLLAHAWAAPFHQVQEVTRRHSLYSDWGHTFPVHSLLPRDGCTPPPLVSAPPHRSPPQTHEAAMVPATRQHNRSLQA